MFAYQFLKLSVIVAFTLLLNACEDCHHSVLSTIKQGASTANVLCHYQFNHYNSSKSVEANSVAYWSCDSNSRDIDANGIPNHQVGQFPNAQNPYTIFEQSVMESYPLHPVETKVATRFGGKHAVIGMMLNGVKISGRSGGSCDDFGEKCSSTDYKGHWNIETIGQHVFDFGIDESNAHVQPDGTYHYHGMPEAFIASLGGNNNKMTLIGWAVDGFPIYARYGYSNPADAGSQIKLMKGSYQLNSHINEHRPSLDVYPLGTFQQDWIYVPGSGDLDECNGQVGVTPEFPEGIYHYYATDSYPYLQRCVKGRI
ncbi:YHYH protein [Psychromonas arctica]|uniref:YHYH protein n=1 Tax=Psychromonas arctica TaxID=168275 RepID=UPI002FD6B5B7